MKIFVDADACPVIEVIESVARWHGVPVMLICDTNHNLESEYSEIVFIGDGDDAVDFAIVKRCQSGDVVVTQDYGLATMAMAKGAYVIHQDGWQYTNPDVKTATTNQHTYQKIRDVAHWRNSNGTHKRTEMDDENFMESLDSLLSEIINNSENLELEGGADWNG